mmetsp:Transcript_58366/g.52579  ORF Transcript_58366/g.52579 Transcript_58366/m.52579 type:complete len:493 (+) Transcript_58366:199-1677(+)
MSVSTENKPNNEETTTTKINGTIKDSPSKPEPPKPKPNHDQNLPNDDNNEELKEDPSENNGMIKNGTSSSHKNGTSHMNGKNGIHLDPTELLEVGMLEHHEWETFTMDEQKLESNCHPVSWSNCDATSFEVRRGPNYVSGQKAPSRKALYTVFALDAYKLPNKINKITKYINVDKYIKQYKVPYDKDKYPLPPIFVLNCMVPNYPPELMGGKVDGEGYQIIMYARLSDEVQELLDRYSQDPDNIQLSPSVDLLRRFIQSDLEDRTNNPLRNRFKCIARIMNPNHTDFGFLANRLVRRYNGRPFLARTSSTFYHEPGKYFAADIDAHIFGYPARQGLSYVKGTIQTAIYDVAFVIEGHTNEELPEQILACCRISKMGVDLCKEFPKKFMNLALKEKEKHKEREQKEKELQQQSNQDTMNLNDNNDNRSSPKNSQYPKSQANLHNIAQNGQQKSNNNDNDNASKSKSATSLVDKKDGGNGGNGGNDNKGWGGWW